MLEAVKVASENEKDKKGVGVFYKLRDKERSKESAYVLVGFLARPFVSFVSHIARYAPSLRGVL